MSFKRCFLLPGLSFICAAGSAAALDGHWLKYATALTMAVGCGCNYLCLYANSGKFPVIGRRTNHEDGVHVPLRKSSRLKPLCDIYNIPHIGIASVGDLVMAVAILISILDWFV